MKRKCFAVAAAIVAASSPALSQPQGTRWSALGVVADGTTDNSAALSALPARTTIIGDCPAGGNIRLTERWMLKSDLTIRVQQGCTVACDWPGNRGAGCLTQRNVREPLTNVSIDGLTLVNVNPSFLGKGLRFWIDHLTLTNLTTRGFYGFAYVRGSDQEWQFNVASPASTIASGAKAATDGLRHFGNSPKVPTRSGRPANVWVHDSVVSSGDGGLQVAPACQPGFAWHNLDADDYLYENSRVTGTPGNMILIGNGAQDIGLSCSNAMTNITVRNITGSTGTSAIRIQNAFNTSGKIANVVISNLTADLASKSALEDQAAIMVRGYDESPIAGITLENITIRNTYARCLDVSAEPATDVTMSRIACDAPRTGRLSNAVIRGTSGAKLQNSTIGNAAGGAIEIGPQPNTANPLLRRVKGGDFTVTAPSITNNKFPMTDGNGAGIVLRNVDRATVTGNDVSAIANQSKIVCAVGRGNNVTRNAGAQDCGP